MENVSRINLKPSGKSWEMRKQLIDYCLNGDESVVKHFGEKQCLAIGWSDIDTFHNGVVPKTYKEYYDNIRTTVTRINHVVNLFNYAEVGDLFWTRDLEGFYWICRVTGKAQARYYDDWDMGAIVPVEAYRYGLEVPGPIVRSFNRPRGGVSETIYGDSVTAFSRRVFNELSGRQEYAVKTGKSSIVDSLPPFDLEELVNTYIQCKYDYYILSNSIANKSTTVNIECVFMSRDIKHPGKAIVQTKSGESTVLDEKDYEDYEKAGYKVFLFAPSYRNINYLKNAIRIQKKEIETFYKEYKSVLPENITKWESI